MSRLKPSRLYWIAVAGLVIAGAFLRLAALGTIPMPIHHDELTLTYDGWSIVETGADRTGARHPAVLRGFGEVDYRPALYAYLVAIPSRFTGFSVVAGRLPSAVLGIASLLLIFSFAKNLAGAEFALVALLFGALSPWHIIFSRLAHEGAVLPSFFVILAFWLWERAASHGYSTTATALLGAALGASANAYQTSRMIGPLFALAVAFDILRHAKRPKEAIGALVVSAVVAASPQLYVMLTDTPHFFSRAGSTLIEAKGAGDYLSKLVRNFVSPFGPGCLFRPSMIDTGLTPVRLLPVEVLFLYTGFAGFWLLQTKRNGRFRAFVYAGFFFTMLPAALTTEPHSVRLSATLAILPLFSAAGVMLIAQLLSRWPPIEKVYLGGVGALTVGSFGLVAYIYLWSWEASGQRSHDVQVQIGRKMRYYAPHYSRVFVTDSTTHQELYIAAFSGVTPRAYQLKQKSFENRAGWDYPVRFDKYEFRKETDLPREADLSRVAGASDLFISRLPLPGLRVLDSAKWGHERFLISDSNRGPLPDLRQAALAKDVCIPGVPGSPRRPIDQLFGVAWKDRMPCRR